MTKYCRYCENVDIFRGVYVCRIQQKAMTRKQMKHTNNCALFKHNPVDALRENVKSYKPTGKKIVQFGGMGEQIRMEEIINV